MKNALIVAAAFLLSATLLLQGENNGGSVTSTAPFTLRGATVNPNLGVTSFPILKGDVIVAGASAVTISIPGKPDVVIPAGGQALIVNGTANSLAVQMETASASAASANSNANANSKGKGPQNPCPPGGQGKSKGSPPVSPSRPCD